MKYFWSFRKCRLHNCNLHTHALQWSIPFVFLSCWSCILFAWWENHSLFQNKPFSIIILGTITDRCNCMPLNALIVYARWADLFFIDQRKSGFHILNWGINFVCEENIRTTCAVLNNFHYFYNVDWRGD